MTWMTLEGELDGVSFQMHPEKDVLLVLVDRGRWTKSDLTGAVLLVRPDKLEEAEEEGRQALVDRQARRTA